MAREMKSSGIAWIGDIPTEWELGRTKNCFFTHKEIAGNTADDYERLALTLNGVIKRSKNDSTGLQPEAFNSYQILRKNELVFKLIDLANIATSRVGYSPYTGLVSPAYIVLHPYEEDESKFGVYYFLSLWQREVFNHMGDDGVRSSLNVGDLLNIPYPIVSIKEKKRIVSYLDTECSRIDSVIEQTRASIEEYKKLKQAVITEAVTKGIRPDRQMKDSGIEWIGEIPDEWEMIRIKHISSLVTDGAHISPETENGVYDFISTVNIDDGKIHFDSCLKTSASSYEYLAATGCQPQRGDVLISKDGTVGKTAIVTEDRDFVVSSSLVIIRPISEMINSEFLNYALNSKTVQDTLVLLMHGAGLKRVSVAKNANLTVARPPKLEQIEIVSYLNKKCKEIDSLIRAKEKSIYEIEKYKRSIIFEYITGKKEVPV